MEIKWRGKTYEYIPRTLYGEKDKDSAKANISKNIYAFDTESVALKDRYEPICFQVSSPVYGEGERLIWLPEKCKALEYFIYDFVMNYSFREFREHHCFMYAHNLTYDWIQLVKNYPDLIAVSRTGVGMNEDYEIYSTKDYKVILRKKGLFTGTAPHFTIKVELSKREWVDIMFRDTFSFFPVSLSKLSKDLGLEVQKMERQEDIGLRDYRKEGNSEDKTYFEKYAKIDAKATRLTAEKIRELHEISGMTRIRVSSPGFAINKMLNVIPEGTEIKSGVSDIEIMQLVIDTYAGGRTGGIYHGLIENLHVIDFHSSYPASMTTLPSFSPTMEYVKYENPEDLTTEELLEIITECHAFMRIDGEELDGKYPSLITNVKGKLTPVYGKFTNLATTGVEACVGIKSGSLKINKVRELVCLVEMDENVPLPFKIFILDAYTRKANAEKGDSEYTSAKLEMNSSYGKLIESRDATPVDDTVSNTVFPYVKGMETEFGQMFYKEYIESLNEDSEKTFEQKYFELCDSVLDNFEESEIEYATFGFLSLTKLEYGRYVVPAAASLITATSRARLLAAMKATNSLYWDTDSLFIKDFNLESVTRSLNTATAWLPGFVKPLRIGDELGDFDIELEGASGYLAGTKRYYLDTMTHRTCKDKSNCNNCPKSIKDSCHVKKALHGIPTAPYDIASDMIEALATGNNFSYEGRPRPTGVKETKDSKLMGKFVKKIYESQFHLDNRLNWTRNENGWNGTVKELSKIKEEMKVNE